MIDIDAHHGNGTQAIFYEDPDVLVGSVHVDPGAGWFPALPRLRRRDRVPAPAPGANRNLPLAPGSGDEPWLEAVGDARRLGARRRARGRSSWRSASTRPAGDPESPLRVTAEGFRAAGRMLGALGLPTVVVQEGGYDLEAIGALVAEALAGIEEGPRRLGRGPARSTARRGPGAPGRAGSRPLQLLAVVRPLSTRIVASPARAPAMSASSVSPTIAMRSPPSRRFAASNIGGSGLPATRAPRLGRGLDGSDQRAGPGGGGRGSGIGRIAAGRP